MTVERDPPALISYYEALEAASREMVSVAQAGDWEHVARLERSAGTLIAQLRGRLRAEPLDADAARARLQILRRIVLNDAQVRCLSQPWLRDLHELLLGRASLPDADSAQAPGTPWSGRLH